MSSTFFLTQLVLISLICIRVICFKSNKDLAEYFCFQTAYTLNPLYWYLHFLHLSLLVNASRSNRGFKMGSKGLMLFNSEVCIRVMV